MTAGVPIPSGSPRGSLMLIGSIFLIASQFQLFERITLATSLVSNAPPTTDGSTMSRAAHIQDIYAIDKPLESPSFFSQASQIGWKLFSSSGNTTGDKPTVPRSPPPIPDLDTWKRGSGGLTDSDRILLFGIYGRANSVFEYGLGESTLIANNVSVPRYAGIDSDAAWVSGTARHVDNRFRFYLADIGPTGKWGMPKLSLQKAAYNYQLAPLIAEQEAFDVYMVDGRFRFGCMMASFLHASSHGADTSETTVMVHDCRRRSYHVADHLLHLVNKSQLLCVYKRRANTTDEMLFHLWNNHMQEIH